MEIFVTGATGFVGSHFVKGAVAAGHFVRAMHRGDQPALMLPGLTWIKCALDEVPSDRMRGCDALVHFAAAGVSPQKASRRDMTYWNVSVPLKLMETAASVGVRRVVIPGSFAEYGRAASLYDLIPPDAPLLPTMGYAASKAACFVSSHAAAIELGLELCYLRIFSAFGEGQFESNFWPALRKAALAGEDFPMTAGEQIRDFVAVEDVATEFLYAAVRNDVSTGQPLTWNVGSGHPVTIREFAEHWWEAFSARGTLKVGALPYRSNEVIRFAPLITEHSSRSGGARS